MKAYEKWNLLALNNEVYKRIFISNLRNFQKFKLKKRLKKQTFDMEEKQPIFQ